MNIIVSDFLEDKLQAINKAGLGDELKYHMSQYSCMPKKVYILPIFEAMQGKYKPTKYTMIVLV